MKQPSIILFLIIIISNVYSQSLKTVTIKTPAPKKTKEIFQVFNDATEIKNGSYKKYKNDKLIETGFYKDNKRDSIWNIYSQIGQLIANGHYSSDSMIGVWNYFSYWNVVVQKYDHDNDSLICIDNMEEKSTKSPTDVYPDTLHERSPIFIGGTDYMYTLIENNMEYPEDAWLNEKTAKVYISFTIDTVGNMKDVKSIIQRGYGFDEEGVRLISLLGNSWIPGIQKGKKVMVQYTLPLTFKIQ